MSEKPMTPPALNAVLNDSVQPMDGLHAPTVQRALEKTATRMPIQPDTIDVSAPTRNETPESTPVDQPHEPPVLAPHAMRAAIAGKTTTTKRAHSLYSALRNEFAPRRMASYSSTSFKFCSLDSPVVFEPGTEVTSSLTEATWLRRWRAKKMPMAPVMMMMSGADDGASTTPPSMQVMELVGESGRASACVLQAISSCRDHGT